MGKDRLAKVDSLRALAAPICLVTAAATVAASLAIAQISYSFVERPGVALGTMIVGGQWRRLAASLRSIAAVMAERCAGIGPRLVHWRERQF